MSTSRYNNEVLIAVVYCFVLQLFGTYLAILFELVSYIMQTFIYVISENVFLIRSE